MIAKKIFASRKMMQRPRKKNGSLRGGRISRLLRSRNRRSRTSAELLPGAVEGSASHHGEHLIPDGRLVHAVRGRGRGLEGDIRGCLLLAFNFAPCVQQGVHALLVREVCVDEVEEELGGVGKLWHGMADAGEVRNRILGFAGEGHPPLTEDHDLIESAVDARRRLMDRRDDDELLRVRQVVNERHHVDGGGSVQPGGGLVQEDDVRLLHERHRDAQPALLSSGQTLDELRTRAGVGAALEAELLDDVAHVLAPSGFGGVHVEVRRVVQDLARGQERPVIVLLLHGEAAGAQGGRVQVLAVQMDASAHDAPVRAQGEAANERGLAGAARAEDGQHAAALHLAVDALHDVLVDLLAFVVLHLHGVGHILEAEHGRRLVHGPLGHRARRRALGHDRFGLVLRHGSDAALRAKTHKSGGGSPRRPTSGGWGYPDIRIARVVRIVRMVCRTAQATQNRVKRARDPCSTSVEPTYVNGTRPAHPDWTERPMKDSKSRPQSTFRNIGEKTSTGEKVLEPSSTADTSRRPNTHNKDEPAMKRHLDSSPWEHLNSHPIQHHAADAEATKNSSTNE
eukprot:scaffold1355_cov268-Pinguiococcus_pyrenoidosus.AAC.5